MKALNKTPLKVKIYKDALLKSKTPFEARNMRMMFGCKAKHHLKKGYLAEKQNTTYKQQTSKDVKRETTKRTSKNVLTLPSVKPLNA